MQQPIVIKQGTNTGQVGIQQNIVTLPMSVNSNMPATLANVMTINKPPGQGVVVTTQNVGGTQPAMIPNVQILNMRATAPGVTPQKSVATVSPRVVIGTPQVVGARTPGPGIALQTLQGLQPLQPGQQGHLLLKTENGQYQLLRVGPAPVANTLPAQTIRLSTIPTHPGVATVSTSVAPASQIQNPLPAAPLTSVQSPQVTATTQKLSDNTKEKCRNFLANLLDLSSKEPQSVEINVRKLIQELIDAKVEPEEFCDRLERLLNASPQPCLIGFLKKSLPLLRLSLINRELVIEGIKPPPHAMNMKEPMMQNLIGNNLQVNNDGTRSTFTTLMPPMIPVTLPAGQTQPGKNLGMLSSSQIQQGTEASGSNLTTLLPSAMPATGSSAQTQSGKTINIISSTQIHPPQNQKVNLKAGTVGGKFSTPVTVYNAGQAKYVNKNKNANMSMNKSIILKSSPGSMVVPGKSLLKEKEKRSNQFARFSDEKMTGDDDINDVTAMGGVNLAEESQRILGSTEPIGSQIRSCKEEYLVSPNSMLARLRTFLSDGIDDVATDVAALMSHAVEKRMKDLLEKAIVAARHRTDDSMRTDSRYVMTSDVKGQLKFLEELDQVEQKRKEEYDREVLMRVAKSRSKNEDPEQAKLKLKAKEMQRVELEEARQREANVTALQAIGPRKRTRVEGPGFGEPSTSFGGPQGDKTSTGSHMLRPKIRRVTMRDLLFVMEEDRALRKSVILYKAYLK